MRVFCQRVIEVQTRKYQERNQKRPYRGSHVIFLKVVWILKETGINRMVKRKLQIKGRF